MDVESYRRWWDYSRAYDEMIRMTDTKHAPWWIVPSDDKKRARINCISHILSSIPYEKVPFDEPKLGKRQKRPDDYVEDTAPRSPGRRPIDQWRIAMADPKSIDPKAAPMSASDLRKILLEEQMAEAKKHEDQKSREEKKLLAFTEDFLKNQVTDDEIAMVRRLVMNAVSAGRFEAMVYSFPSDLCTDSGRAINSNDPQWTETLRGKAKEFYERYLKFGKPQGFKLKAMIINFPGGMPGDVGFFLNWAPETK
jgi:hypothetical protein